jgi:MFS family permease
VPGSALAAASIIAFMGVFAFGETLLQPTVPAISNDLASDHTRGRYNAINAAAFQGGAIAGPAVAGLLLDHDLAAGYIALMLVGCVSVGLMALALERRLPAATNGITEATPEPAAPAVKD